MAHTTTRIYIDNNASPKVGISHADMRAVLGVSGNNMGLIIQNAQNIVKPFAKYKPTRCGGFHPTNWWKGPSVTIYDTTGYLCGLGVTAYDSLSALKTAMDGNTLGWTWERPRGNTVTPAEWQVRRDFDCYEHASTSPFQSVGVPNDTYPTQMQCDISLISEFERGNTEMLGIADFTVFDSWYFGFALYNVNNQLVGIGTVPSGYPLSTKSDAARKVYFTPPANAAGNCKLYPFFSRTQFNWRSTEPTGTKRFVPLPIGIQTIVVASGGPIANLSFSFGSGGTVTFNSTQARFTVGLPALTATNSGSSQSVLTNSSITYRVHVESASDPSVYWDSTSQTINSSGTVTVPGNGSATVFSAATKYFNDQGILTFFQNNGGSWNNYRHFVQVFYTYNGNDFLLATYEYPTS